MNQGYQGTLGKGDAILATGPARDTREEALTDIEDFKKEHNDWTHAQVDIVYWSGSR